MKARPNRTVIALACAFGLHACGQEAALVISTSLRGFQVPQEIDRLHLELAEDAGPLIGRNFPLADGQTDFSVRLLPGDRMPETFTVVLYAFLASVPIARSFPESTGFEADETRHLTLLLLRQ